MGGYTRVCVDEAVEISWLIEAIGFLLRVFRSRWTFENLVSSRYLFAFVAEGQQDWCMGS